MKVDPLVYDIHRVAKAYGQHPNSVLYEWDIPTLLEAHEWLDACDELEILANTPPPATK